MSGVDCHAFARDWQAAWNAHDLDQIMSHYAEKIVFNSRKAQTLVGSGVIRGKAELRSYWEQALARQPTLRFSVRDIFVGHDMLVIIYSNHRDVLAAETLHFGADGLVIQASACHKEE